MHMCFFCDFQNEQDLKNYWKTIANEIAIEYQSQNSSEIERANFYIGYFSQVPVSIELQNTIEQDPYCARKYVFDRYEQDNPNEYRLIVIDTINLIDTERGIL